MPLLRPGTFDLSIWRQAPAEYPTLPSEFAPGEIVLDVGCHTGAVSLLAAERGATVVGYEASRHNHGLAVLNTRGRPEITTHHGAVWRSDVPPTRVVFTPCVDPGNTGGGSVMFPTPEDHWQSRPLETAEPAPPATALPVDEVPTVALDDVLRDLGRVRFLKLDVEGAEFPILLTARELDRVSELAGEYHELDDAGMTRLSASARVGDERYSEDLLRRCLLEAGFDVVEQVPQVFGRGHFWARRTGQQ